MNQTNRFNIKAGSCTISFLREGNNLYQLGMNTEEQAVPVLAPLYQLAVAGEDQGSNWALVHCYSEIPMKAEIVSCKMNTSCMEAHFIYHELEIVVNYQGVPEANGFQITTTVRNRGDVPVHMTYLSSGTVTGLLFDEKNSILWNQSERYRIHYFAQTWQGEGQHRDCSLEDAGIYYTSVHPGGSNFTLTSRSSWTTGKYIPLLFTEDQETSKIWYAQYEPRGDWQIELDCIGSWTEDESVLSLLAAGISPQLAGAYPLAPGESYTAESVFVGCCEGGMEEASRSLTKYRRSVLLQGKDFAERPVFFNDYMNCLWARPTKEKLLPLIEKAAAAGAEGFCIDAGWYADPNGDWCALGDWEPWDVRFGDGGLQSIIDTIRGYGMRAGLWLELEMCSASAKLYGMPDDWFVSEYGKRVGNRNRTPLDFSNSAVCTHFHKVIDRLISMGVSFFKNDYNMAIFRGDDTKTLPCRSMKEEQDGFFRFIDEVKKQHPDLIIENCGSGAMRQDYGTLRHFDLQSVSDQEIYTLMPSILTGQLAAIVPEQLGVWSYPYPVLFLDIDKSETLFEDPTYLAQMADGEQTIFNMVSGVCGTLYQSGRIDKTDEKNFALLQQGIELFKQERAWLANAYPCWPLGFARLEFKDQFICVGFADEQYQRMLIYVWRQEGTPTVSISLAKLVEKKGCMRQLYPAAGTGYDVAFSFDSSTGDLTVTLEKPNSARIFEWIAE